MVPNCFYKDKQYRKDKIAFLQKKSIGVWPMLAPQKVEFKNLWWDFRKVVDYIQQNEKWLLPA